MSSIENYLDGVRIYSDNFEDENNISPKKKKKKIYKKKKSNVQNPTSRNK